MAEVVQRFFHPSGVDEMLDLMLPRLHGDDIDSILATQAFLVHFLPFSHPQKWLPVCKYSVTGNGRDICLTGWIG